MTTSSSSPTLLVQRKGSKIPSISESPARGARGSRVAEGDGRRPLALDARAPKGHLGPSPEPTLALDRQPAPRPFSISRRKPLLHITRDLTPLTPADRFPKQTRRASTGSAARSLHLSNSVGYRPRSPSATVTFRSPNPSTSSRLSSRYRVTSNDFGFFGAAPTRNRTSHTNAPFERPFHSGAIVLPRFTESRYPSGSPSPRPSKFGRACGA
jgi:hypothetical protein